MRRILKTSLWILSVPMAFLFLEGIGILGICYLRPIDNIPFEKPVSVSKVDDYTILLVDGRRLIPAGGVDEFLREAINESGGVLGLMPQGENRVAVFSRRHRTICGLGMPAFVIPVIPLNVPRYQQREIMWSCPWDDVSNRK